MIMVTYQGIAPCGGVARLVYSQPHLFSGLVSLSSRLPNCTAASDEHYQLDC